MHGDISYEVGGTTITGGHPHSKVTVILDEELNALRALISDLTARVVALEAQPH